MNKKNIDAVIKVAGIAFTVVGMVLSNISTTKENGKMIEQAVENHFKK